MNASVGAVRPVGAAPRPSPAQGAGATLLHIYSRAPLEETDKLLAFAEAVPTGRRASIRLGAHASKAGAAKLVVGLRTRRPETRKWRRKRLERLNQRSEMVWAPNAWTHKM